MAGVGAAYELDVSVTLPPTLMLPTATPKCPHRCEEVCSREERESKRFPHLTRTLSHLPTASKCNA
mgnify:CR=1 FL=1